MRKLVLVLTAVAAVSGNAAITLDTDKGNTSFRVKGIEVSSVDAVRAAIAGEEVLRCKPKSASGKKVFFAGNGKVAEVVECTPVELKVNPKSGSPTWKAKK